MGGDIPQLLGDPSEVDGALSPTSEVEEVVPGGRPPARQGAEWALARTWAWQPGEQVPTPALPLVGCLPTVSYLPPGPLFKGRRWVPEAQNPRGPWVQSNTTELPSGCAAPGPARWPASELDSTRASGGFEQSFTPSAVPSTRRKPVLRPCCGV